MRQVPASFTKPTRLWSRAEVVSHPCPVPSEPGIYAWFFKEIPPRVPADGCREFDRMRLLYVGISPKAPPKAGGRPSKQNLRTRIRTHYRGNASGSTLRLSLGCLLAKTLGIELRRHGDSERLHFGKAGEENLSAWMARNAFVAWHLHPAPWEAEASIINELSLPLNLDHNTDHEFHDELAALRRQMRRRARELPTLNP